MSTIEAVAEAMGLNVHTRNFKVQLFYFSHDEWIDKYLELHFNFS